MTDNPDQDREPQEAEAEIFTFPPGIRPVLVTLLAAVMVFVMVLIVIYSQRSDFKPSEYGLGTVLTFCLAGLVVLLVPWNKLGLTITEIGGIKVAEKMIKVQTHEQNKDVVELRDKILAIENQLSTMKSGTAPASKPPSLNDPLADLIKQFLLKYKHSFFNAARIVGWGSKQPGFGEFSHYKVDQIDDMLRRLNAENQVRLKLSTKTGHKLYGAK
jgi:hypothetical protein